MAQKKGWDFLNSDVEILNLADAIINGASQQEINILGRVPNLQDKKIINPFVSISQEDLTDRFGQKNINIILSGLLETNTKGKRVFQNNNKAWCKCNGTPYEDLYIKSEILTKWLKNAKKEYQGRQQKT